MADIVISFDNGNLWNYALMISFNLMKNCWPLVDIPLCMDKGQRKRLDIGISVAIHMSVEISICYKIKVSYYIVKHCMIWNCFLKDTIAITLIIWQTYFTTKSFTIKYFFTYWNVWAMIIYIFNNQLKRLSLFSSL